MVFLMAKLTAPCVITSCTMSAFVQTAWPCSSIWILELIYASSNRDTSFTWLGSLCDDPQHRDLIWYSKCFCTAWRVGMAGLQSFKMSHDAFGPWTQSVIWITNVNAIHVTFDWFHLDSLDIILLPLVQWEEFARQTCHIYKPASLANKVTSVNGVASQSPRLANQLSSYQSSDGQSWCRHCKSSKTSPR